VSGTPHSTEEHAQEGAAKAPVNADVYWPRWCTIGD
jgi:hypothetical protein